jgi:MFS family permease
MPAKQTGVILRLGSAQTLAWASSYYLLAILAEPMALELGLSISTVFAGFSLALVVSSFLGQKAGAFIDGYGGKTVLTCTNVVFAAALALLALAQGPVVMFLAWALMGMAMAAGLYDGAFATLVKLYGTGSRGAITGITLLAGFASTVGWPITAWLEGRFGWREACLFWAFAHLVVGIPLNITLPRHQAQKDATTSAARSTLKDVNTDPGAWITTILLATVFALTWFVATAMAAHLPRLLQIYGYGAGAALAMASMVGPAQVVARLLEFGFMRTAHPMILARVASAAHPAGALLMMAIGGPAGVAFALLHGAGNGVLTIAKGTLPLVIFGPDSYGARLGLLMAPARITQAFAPYLFGLALDHLGKGALWLSIGIGLISCLALLGLKPKTHSTLCEA